MHLAWNSEEDFNLDSYASSGIIWKNKINVVKVSPVVVQVHYDPENDDDILQDTLKDCKWS